MSVASSYIVRRTLQTPSVRALSSKASLVVNAVGVDRPGIVSQVTKHVTASGGNVGQSHATRLGSHFSLMMLLETPSENVETLKQSIRNITDINVSIIDARDDAAELKQPVIRYSGVLTLEGADNPGIVHRVTQILADQNLSIEKMKTTDAIAPHGGTTLFQMQAVVHAFEPLRSDFDIATIQANLNDVGDGLNCDISLEPFDESDDFEISLTS